MRQFLQIHHRTIWTVIAILAVIVLSFWLYGLHEGAVGTGVQWRHS